MNIYRGRINEIIFEFTPPQKYSQGIIIICDGLPSVPNRKELMIMLANNGFVSIFPRYKGTWESNGEFLKETPVKDIEEVLQVIKKREITELYFNRKIKLPNKPVHLLGSSFGASVALALSGNKNISKIVALSAIVDFKEHNKTKNEEDLVWVGEFIRRAFGEGYRFNNKRWNEMIRGNLFNPPQNINQETANNILIGYGKLDSQVNYKKIEKYISNNKINQVIFELNGGHMTFSKLPQKIWDKIIMWLSIK